MTFYDNFPLNKKRFGLNNKTIADQINMSSDGLRMAINRKSLTELEIEKIETFFNSCTEKVIYEKKTKKTISKDYIDSLFENEYFKEKLSEFLKK